jgi:hypothetical protein
MHKMNTKPHVSLHVKWQSCFFDFNKNLVRIEQILVKLFSVDFKENSSFQRYIWTIE